MSEVIYKYPFRITDGQIIKIPQGARILSIQVQDGVPCIWAAVNDANEDYDLRLIVVGTGQRIPQGVTYISTIQLNDFVWHIFYDPSIPINK